MRKSTAWWTLHGVWNVVAKAIRRSKETKQKKSLSYWDSQITWNGDTSLIAAFSGSSIWQITPGWNILRCSHCGKFNLGNGEAAESFTHMDDGWAGIFRCKELSTFRTEQFWWWRRPWRIVLLHNHSAQATRKPSFIAQVEVSYTQRSLGMVNIYDFVSQSALS